jgi:hypothetical protein
MAKKDLSKELQALYFPSAKEPVLVNVPPMGYAVVDGEGDPNTSKDFQEAIEALYGVAYTAKFAAKKAGLRDFVVMPLEALWWAEDFDDFLQAEKEKWKWTAMIMQPKPMDRKLFDESVEALRGRKNPPSLSKVRFERFREGRSAQIMHIGPYAAERPTIERLHRFIYESGYKLAGKHHEIYLGDPRRTAPERLKTVLRQPVTR